MSGGGAMPPLPALVRGERLGRCDAAMRIEAPFQTGRLRNAAGRRERPGRAHAGKERAPHPPQDMRGACA